MKWQCRWVTKQDREALLSLFLTAFGHPMTTSLWTWKYAGQEESGVLAHVDNKIIAYYGGLPRTFWLQDKKLGAVQICDVMVAPEMRGVLTRRGAFAQTAATFLNAKTGKDKIYRFAFGFPSDRHARLGKKTGLYAQVDTILEASWPATTSYKSPFWLKTRPISESDDITINKLWQTMQASLHRFLLPQKNAQFFNWRYLKHPTHTYIAKVVSWKWCNKIIGIVILRDHGPEHGLELMDLLGPPENLSWLLKVSQSYAGQMSRSRLFCWLTPNVLSYLPKPITPSEIAGVHIATPDLAEMTDQLQSRCWLMGGDTDFR